MAIVKYKRGTAYTLNLEDRATLLALTDEEIEAGADPDDRPLTANEQITAIGAGSLSVVDSLR